MADFTNLDRRRVKARAIATRLRVEGMSAEVATAMATEPKWCRQVERDADVPRSSPETWALALQQLAEQPPVFETDRAPGCRCHVDPDTGTLYEYSGWPCPHGTADHPRMPTITRDDAPPATPGPGDPYGWANA